MMTDAFEAQRSLEALIQQQEDIAKQIQIQRQATRDAALKTVKDLCKLHEFTAGDLKGCLKVSRATRGKAPTKRRTTRK
jgi:hypothetical protein